MKTLIVLGALVPLATLGCTNNKTASSFSSTNLKPEYTITAEGVGDYVIGSSTLAEILGEDTADARRQFADRGLNFQFDRGVKLTGITVSSTEYRLENGLAVGATANAVRQTLGEPDSTKIEGEKLSINGLVYDDFTFILDGDDTVAAIFVGGAN